MKNDNHIVKVYGIPNCDTVKKGIDFLKQNKVQFEFHDFKKQGITVGKLKEWSRIIGWETLLNTKSSTYRNLLKNGLKQPDKISVIKLMQENSSIIKRPVFEKNGMLLVGFSVPELQSLINK